MSLLRGSGGAAGPSQGGGPRRVQVATRGGKKAILGEDRHKEDAQPNLENAGRRVQGAPSLRTSPSPAVGAAGQRGQSSRRGARGGRGDHSGRGHQSFSPRPYHAGSSNPNSISSERLPPSGPAADRPAYPSHHHPDRMKSLATGRPNVPLPIPTSRHSDLALRNSAPHPYAVPAQHLHHPPHPNPHPQPFLPTHPPYFPRPPPPAPPPCPTTAPATAADPSGPRQRRNVSGPPIDGPIPSGALTHHGLQVEVDEDVKPVLARSPSPPPSRPTTSSAVKEGTLGFSRPSLPSLCWVSDPAERQLARKTLMEAKIRELGNSCRILRRPPMWRDDGLAFDWTLELAQGTASFSFPREGMSEEDKRAFKDACKAEEEKKGRKVDKCRQFTNGKGVEVLWKDPRPVEVADDSSSDMDVDIEAAVVSSEPSRPAVSGPSLPFAGEPSQLVRPLSNKAQGKLPERSVPTRCPQSGPISSTIAAQPSIPTSVSAEDPPSPERSQGASSLFGPSPPSPSSRSLDGLPLIRPTDTPLFDGLPPSQPAAAPSPPPREATGPDEPSSGSTSPQSTRTGRPIASSNAPALFRPTIPEKYALKRSRPAPPTVAGPTAAPIPTLKFASCISKPARPKSREAMLGIASRTDQQGVQRPSTSGASLTFRDTATLPTSISTASTSSSSALTIDTTSSARPRIPPPPKLSRRSPILAAALPFPSSAPVPHLASESTSFASKRPRSISPERRRTTSASSSASNAAPVVPEPKPNSKRPRSKSIARPNPPARPNSPAQPALPVSRPVPAAVVRPSPPLPSSVTSVRQDRGRSTSLAAGEVEAVHSDSVMITQLPIDAKELEIRRFIAQLGVLIVRVDTAHPAFAIVQFSSSDDARTACLLDGEDFRPGMPALVVQLGARAPVASANLPAAAASDARTSGSRVSGARSSLGIEMADAGGAHARRASSPIVLTSDAEDVSPDDAPQEEEDEAEVEADLGLLLEDWSDLEGEDPPALGAALAAAGAQINGDAEPTDKQKKRRKKTKDGARDKEKEKDKGKRKRKSSVSTHAGDDVNDAASSSASSATSSKPLQAPLQQQSGHAGREPAPLHLEFSTPARAVSLGRAPGDKTRWLVAGDGLCLHASMKGEANIWRTSDYSLAAKPVSLKHELGRGVEDVVLAGQRLVMGRSRTAAAQPHDTSQIAWVDVHSLSPTVTPTIHTASLCPHLATGISSLASLPSDMYSLDDGPSTSAFASGGFDHQVKAWKISEEGIVKHVDLHSKHTSRVDALQYCTMRNYIFSGGADGQVCTWDARGQKHASFAVARSPEPVHNLYLRDAHPSLIVVEVRRLSEQYRMYDLRTNALELKYGDAPVMLPSQGGDQSKSRQTTRFTRGAFCGDLFVKGTGSSVKIWDLRKPAVPQIVDLFPNSKTADIHQVLFDEPGTRLLTLTKESLYVQPFVRGADWY